MSFGIGVVGKIGTKALLKVLNSPLTEKAITIFIAKNPEAAQAISYVFSKLKGIGHLFAETRVGQVLKKIDQMLDKGINKVTDKLKLAFKGNRSSVKIQTHQQNTYAEPHANPQNVAQHEKHKDELREKMGRPYVQDTQLKSILKKYHKIENNCVGSGSTAAAMRYEIETGSPVGDKYHFKKGIESMIRLEN